MQVGIKLFDFPETVLMIMILFEKKDNEAVGKRNEIFSMFHS